MVIFFTCSTFVQFHLEYGRDGFMNRFLFRSKRQTQILKTIARNDFEFYAKWSYDNFVLKQPHIKTKGLFKIGQKYYILCEEINQDSRAYDGTNLYNWFDNNRIATCPIWLTAEIPQDGIKLNERNLTSLVNGEGSPRTFNQVLYDINLLLPPKIPNYKIQLNNDERIICLIFEKPVGYFIIRKIEKVLKSLGLPFGYEIKTQTPLELKTIQLSKRHDPLQLVISKTLKQNLEKPILNLLEEDEDFWLSNRHRIFSGEISKVDKIVNLNWSSKESRCILNTTVFPSANLRNYLTIFDKVIITYPLHEKEVDVFNSLGVDLKILTELARIGRVQFVLPQSVERYNTRSLAVLSEVNPDSIVLSRRLAASTIIDARNRFPLFFPPFGIQERREFLYLLNQLCENVPNDQGKNFLKLLIIELGNSWAKGEEMVNSRGAMATSVLGMAPIVASWFKSTIQVDAFIELNTANMTIDWGAPFNATVIPINSSDYSEENNTLIISNFYSGINHQAISTFINKNKILLNGILAIDSEVDIIDFANSFNSSDIKRFRKLIYELSQDVFNEDQTKVVIDKFNKEVSRYEKAAKRQSEFDFSGLLRNTATLTSAATAAVATQIDPIFRIGLGSVPLLIWFIQRLSNNKIDNYHLSLFIDYLKAKNKKSKPNSVLVSRLRKKVELL